jgi:hypothetical protein
VDPQKLSAEPLFLFKAASEPFPEGHSASECRGLSGNANKSLREENLKLRRGAQRDTGPLAHNPPPTVRIHESEVVR